MAADRARAEAERAAFLSGFEPDFEGSGWLERLREAKNGSLPGRLGPYELVSEASRGGQGVVFRARQLGTKREIALKRLLAGSLATPAMRRRFEREIEAAASLSHPNVVTIYGVEMIDGEPLLAMEWIDGIPVTEWARDRWPHDLRAVVELFLKICAAVQHAHRHGLIHRDLKPSNVLVDARDEPHVLDFGLAKRFGERALAVESMTATAGFAGTPAYASPEQVHRSESDVDVRTDLYSLGLILYEILAGELPYQVDAGLGPLLRAIEETVPVAPSTRRRGSNRELDCIVLKALEKDREHRYASVEAFADDLQRHLAGEAVLAHPPSAAYEFAKLLRRRWLPASFTATVFALAIMFALFERRHARELAFERDKEVLARERADDLRARADARLGFFLGMLAAADPERSGRVVTVRQVLDESAPRIDLEFASDTRARAALHEVVGSTYLRLGCVEEADRHVRAALDADPKAGPIERAKLRRLLGEVALMRGAYVEAESLLREVLEVQVELLGRAHAESYGTESKLASVLILRASFVEAEARARSVLEGAPAREEDDGAGSTSGLRLLGEVLCGQGRWAESEEVLRRALALEQKRHLRRPVEEARILAALGATALDSGHLTDARMLLEEALQLRTAALGAEHPVVAETELLLVRAMADAGDLDAAEALVTRAQSALSATFGPKHPEVGSALSLQAEISFLRGRLGEARAFAERALSVLETTSGAMHPTVATLHHNLAELDSAHGEYDRAQQRLEKAAAIRQRMLGGDHPELAHSLDGLGLLAKRRGDAKRARDPAASVDAEYLQAECFYRQAIEVLRSRTDGLHPKLVILLNNLGALARSRGDLAQSEVMYREAVAVGRARLPAGHEDLLIALRNLGVLFMIDDRRFSEAEDLWCDVLARWYEVLPTDDWRIAYAEMWAGTALGSQGRFTEAEALLLSGVTGVERHLGSQDPWVLMFENLLATAYSRWGRAAEARKWSEKVRQAGREAR